MDLFEGDSDKIDRMNQMIASEFGFDEGFDVCGQKMCIRDRKKTLLSG